MSPDPVPAPPAGEPATGQSGVRFDATPPTTHGADAHDPKAIEIQCAKQPAPFSPPDSNNAAKSDPTESELSDLGDDVVDTDMPDAAPADDIGEIYPDHWSSGVPVFKPTMREFKDFTLFMEKVNWYGMRSGIIKIIPPQEWRDAQPAVDDLVKQIRVRDPIKQEIMGSGGTYRQVNFVHQRPYTLRQWRELCEQSEHQPPARRGERRLNSDKPKAPRPKAAPKKTASAPASGGKRGRGRPPKRGKKGAEEVPTEERPMTPVSDKQETDEGEGPSEKTKQDEAKQEANIPSIEAEEEDTAPAPRRKSGAPKGKPKTQSTSARRKYSRREGSVMVDEEHFEGFDYRMDVSDFTPERCEELERIYWKTLTYAPPLYGADLMGTLFDDRTEEWNLNKLPNLLDVLGTKVPGVNTAYLYLGMWKATFAWHLEDVDLYSINYLHFGAPKQWYSISQADARRFEAAMKSIWPTEGKACDQFLRHKSFLISPSRLLNDFGIKVNKCVSYPGEFVVTYPYGYHSGYNLGYNCAEAVNFALDSWLPMGKIAKKCECALAQDSVWVDVYEIERRLRGEETEYEETEDEGEDEDVSALLTPPDTTSPNTKASPRKRKRGAEKGPKPKKTRLRAKVKEEPPCCLCPNDIPGAEILPTEDGSKAHRMCALYLPETYVEMVDGSDVVMNIAAVSKERKDLRCLYCRSKRGACFQCSQKTCARAYHATCAAAAGVFVEEAEVPVYDDDGTEYKEQAFEFSCRFHRTKRDRKLDGDQLEADESIRKAAKGARKGEICQFQYFKGDIFAGVVVENRLDEETFLVDIVPKGERMEVEWKWLLLPDPSDYHLPKASPNALPLPSSTKAKKELNAKRAEDETPRKGTEFAPGYTWTEFTTHDAKNAEQVKVDLSNEGKLWFYLGENSTDAKAQYTGDLARRRHDPRSNYLATIPKPPRPSKYAPPSFASPRPYVYKPRVEGGQSVGATPAGSFGTYYASQALASHGPSSGTQPAHGGQAQPQTGSQDQGQNYQQYQYQYYQPAQGYQPYRNYQSYQSAPSQPQAQRPQGQQPQAAYNQATAPAAGHHPNQPHTGGWSAGYNSGYGNAYRSGPSPVQGTQPSANPATTMPRHAGQRVQTPTTTNPPTTQPGQGGQQSQRPTHQPAPQGYWTGHANGYPQGAGYPHNTGQYHQPGARAPTAYHPAYPSPTTHGGYQSHTTTTAPPAPNTARPQPPTTAAAPSAAPPAPNSTDPRYAPNPGRPTEPNRATNPPPATTQADKTPKPAVTPPVKQTPVPLPAKYLAAMARPKPEPRPAPTNANAATPANSSAAPRISTTPVPLPRIPSLPRPAEPKVAKDVPTVKMEGQGGNGKGDGGIELPDVPADSSALVERMISNLHRVSGRVEG